MRRKNNTWLLYAALAVIVCVVTSNNVGAESKAFVFEAYGTSDGAKIRGRVVEHSPSLDEPSENTTLVGRTRKSLGLLRLKPKPNEHVVINLGNYRGVATTDEGGYFEWTLSASELIKNEIKPGEIPIRIENIGGEEHFGEGTLYVLPRNGKVAVVDIDGTILDDEPDKKVKLAWNTLVNDSKTLKMFPGTAQFLQFLVKENFSIVYMSSSPDQLYPRLKRFVEHNGMPPGPFVLKRLSKDKTKEGKRQKNSLVEHQAYKLRNLNDINRLLPRHQFFLVGDDANDDQEVFETFGKDIGAERIVLAAIHSQRRESKQVDIKGQFRFTDYKDLRQKLILSLPGAYKRTLSRRSQLSADELRAPKRVQRGPSSRYKTPERALTSTKRQKRGPQLRRQ